MNKLLLSSILLFAGAGCTTTSIAQEAAEDEFDILDFVVSEDAETTVEKIDMEHLRVRRIDIVDENNVIRMTLAGALPGPIIDGVEYARNFPVSGAVLRDDKGNEIGGFGFSEGLGGPIFALDHNNAEAAGFAVRPNGEVIMFMGSKPEEVREPRLAGRLIPATNSVGNSSAGITMSPEGLPELVLTDKEGNPRIRLGVKAGDFGTLEFLNEDGAVVKSVTPETVRD